MFTNEDFEDIYKKYHKFSVKIAYKIVKDAELAKDISQDVFYHLYTLGDYLDIENEDKMRGLITVSTTNKAKDYVKSAYAKRVSSSDRIEELDVSVVPDAEAAILSMEKNEYKKMVLMRFRDYNPENFDILMKVKYFGIPSSVVAKEYGITVNNLNGRILRARLWLKAEYMKLYK